MDMNEYQQQAMSIAPYPATQRIIYPTLGLTGEAGEVADKVKKTMRDNGGLFDNHRKTEIAKEIGDVLWNCAALARDLGYDLDVIAHINIAKLSSRVERGVIGGEGDNR